MIQYHCVNRALWDETLSNRSLIKWRSYFSLGFIGSCANAFYCSNRVVFIHGREVRVETFFFRTIVFGCLSPFWKTWAYLRTWIYLKQRLVYLRGEEWGWVGHRVEFTRSMLSITSKKWNVLLRTSYKAWTLLEELKQSDVRAAFNHSRCRIVGEVIWFYSIRSDVWIVPNIIRTEFVVSWLNATKKHSKICMLGFFWKNTPTGRCLRGGERCSWNQEFVLLARCFLEV